MVDLSLDNYGHNILLLWIKLGSFKQKYRKTLKFTSQIYFVFSISTPMGCDLFYHWQLTITALDHPRRL